MVQTKSLNPLEKFWGSLLKKSKPAEQSPALDFIQLDSHVRDIEGS